MSATLLTQIRFRIRNRRKPTRDLIEKLGRYWLATGETPPGVTIEPMVWDGRGPEEAREYLRSRRVLFGCPGVVKQYADPRVTMCDFDTRKAPDLKRFWRVAHTINARPELIRYDRTRRGWHVLIRWDRKFSPAEIVALQAMFGSDPAREMFNLARVLSGGARSNRWNLLFEEKLR